jgi:hypothetical protein
MCGVLDEALLLGAHKETSSSGITAKAWKFPRQKYGRAVELAGYGLGLEGVALIMASCRLSEVTRLKISGVPSLTFEFKGSAYRAGTNYCLDLLLAYDIVLNIVQHGGANTSTD